MDNENLVPLEQPDGRQGAMGQQECLQSKRELALREHWAIIKSWKQLGDDWVALTRRVQYFKENKLYREIVDPSTREGFTRIDAWAEFALGKSSSTIFAHMRTVRELTGIVPDEKLAGMKRQNASELVRLKKAKKPIDATVIDDAIALPHADFKARHADEKGAVAEIQVIEVCNLGPFQVTSQTADLFKQALAAAKQNLEHSGHNADDDAAIRMIAQAFLDPERPFFQLILPQNTRAGDTPLPAAAM